MSVSSITVIGTGYVGLVTGTCLAECGLDVTCIDIDEIKIEKLLRGVVPIYEPGLDSLVTKNVENGRLKFSTNLKWGIENAEVIFIAVGTPPQEDGSADLRHVEAVAKSIGRYINGYKVVVNKSTVPVGTGKRVKQIIAELSDISFDVVSNPEFLREGTAIKDFMNPDRIVLGSDNEQAIQIMKEVYKYFAENGTTFVISNLETAELIKYAANSFLAVKISFINEIANLCEKLGADVKDVAYGIGCDERIGRKFLNPGPGYGGSCFPKDTLALARIGQDCGSPVSTVENAIKANLNQKLKAVDKIKNAMGDIKDKTIAVLGLAFKPETDDMREAPAITIITELEKLGARIKAYDPKAMEEASWRLKDIKNFELCNDEYSTSIGADALVIITEWKQFRNLDLADIKRNMRDHYLFDLRNIFEPVAAEELGYRYYCLGRCI